MFFTRVDFAGLHIKHGAGGGMSASRDEDADSLTGLLGQLMILGAGKDGRGMPVHKQRGAGGSSGGGGAGRGGGSSSSGSSGGRGGGAAGGYTGSWKHDDADRDRLKASVNYFKNHPNGRDTEARRKHTKTKQDYADWAVNSEHGKRVQAAIKSAKEKSLQTAQLKNAAAVEWHRQTIAENKDKMDEMRAQHVAEMQIMDARRDALRMRHRDEVSEAGLYMLPPYTPESSPFGSERDHAMEIAEQIARRERHARWDAGLGTYQRRMAEMRQTHKDQLLDLHHKRNEKLTAHHVKMQRLAHGQR